VAAAYAAAGAAASSAGLTAAADGDILVVLWCNEAFALLRLGDYKKAKRLCMDALSCVLPAKVRDKAEKRLRTAETGLQLLRGPVERVVVAGTSLEDAVHKNQLEVVACLIRSTDFMEARCIIECRSLVHKAAMCGFVDCVQLLVEGGGGDFEGLQKGCPAAWDACRRARGHIGRTPLYAAAAGSSYPLAGRAMVAEYLLQRGADPLAASDDPKLTPFVKACGNNSYAIVKLMLDFGLCEAPAGVGLCKAALTKARRQLNNTRGGKQNNNARGGKALRQLVELLSRAIDAVEGAATGAKDELLEALETTVQVGDAMFNSGEFAEAARLYRGSVEHCERALAKRTDADATAAWEERYVACCCKAAASCLRLGASKKAEVYCNEVLRVQPAHAEATARLGKARAADAKFEREVHKPWKQAMEASSDHHEDGQHGGAVQAARRAVGIAHRAGEGVLEAKALAVETEMLHVAAVQFNSDSQAVTCAVAAMEVIGFCRAHSEIPDFLLTNIATGNAPQCMLDTCHVSVKRQSLFAACSAAEEMCLRCYVRLGLGDLDLVLVHATVIVMRERKGPV
jgi:tetratricopeptide (TPR) repeat protein